MVRLFIWRWFVVGKILTVICFLVALERGRFEVPVSPRMQEVEFVEVSKFVEGVGYCGPVLVFRLSLNVCGNQLLYCVW